MASLAVLPAQAAPNERSLVDRVMDILTRSDMPRIEVRPETLPNPNTLPNQPPAAMPVPAQPPRAGVEIARNFLPVYALDQGPETPPAVMPFFASAPVMQSHANVRTLVIMLPDADREAAKAFAYARSAQEQAIARQPEWVAEDTYIIAPQFLSPEDIAARAAEWPDHGSALLRWVGESWVYGAESSGDFLDAAQQNATSMNGNALGNSWGNNWVQRRGQSAFTVMDYLLMLLVTPQRFPNLKRVVIAGMGAGADFVQRYAMLGVVPDMLQGDGLEIRFVAANVRDYLYPDTGRAGKKAAGQYSDPDEGIAFAPLTEEQCRIGNVYPFGLDQLPLYGRRQGVTDIRLRFGARNVIYLQNAEMIDPLTDTTPEACARMAQGPTFAERATIYFASLTRFYGDELAKNQRLHMLPGLGSDPLALWRSPCATSALFGDGNCAIPGKTGW